MDDSQNPWAGLASYEDPENAKHKLKFCGRDDESYDMAKLIMGNIFVTLYGKSGIGKTSLLNAGVFPELRDNQFTPLSLRLGIMDAKEPGSYQSVIVEAIERTVGSYETIDVIEEQRDKLAVDYLWNYFARHRFYGKDDEAVSPVIVFDQFEELFRDHRKEAELLLCQLDYINDKDHQLDSCLLDGQPYHYETNFRFVIAIREDDLYRLEDSIDNCFLPALKRCRYRLRSLSEQGAKDAILIPGKGVFNDDEKEHIAQNIIAKSKNEDGSISTNIISLLCSRLFVEFLCNHDVESISLTLVTSFIRGNPFERFYNEATSGFSESDKSYIEDHFVDEFGRRNSVSENDFLLNVNKGNRLLTGNMRILQRVSVSSGSNYRIELIHDSFCNPLIELKEKRQLYRRYKLYARELAIAVFLLCAAWFYISHLQDANNKMEKREIQNNVARVKVLTDKGDSYTARLLAMELLGDKIKYIKDFHVPEMESALRYADGHENAILEGHNAAISNVALSPDGKQLASASYDGTVKLWDIQTGALVLSIKNGSRLDAVTFSKDGNNLVTGSQDGLVKVWSLSGKLLYVLKGHKGFVEHVQVSPDGELIASASDDKTIRLWSLSTKKCVMVLRGHRQAVNQIDFSPDGKNLLSCSDDKTIRQWNTKDGTCQRILAEHTGEVLSVEYAPDGNSFVSSAKDNGVIIWDAHSGQCMKTLQGHSDWVYGVSFSPNGRYIATGSYDTTVRIWDVNSGACVDVLKGHTMYVADPVFTRDGSRVISGSVDNTIRIWEIPALSSKELPQIQFNGTIRKALYGNNDNKIVAINNSNDVQLYYYNTIYELKGHSHPVLSIAISPTEDVAASASKDQTVRLWNLKTKECKRVIRTAPATPCAIDFSHDGKMLAIGLSNGMVGVWSAMTGERKATFETKAKRVYDVACSPVGNTAATLTDDGTIHIWNIMDNTGLQKIHTGFPGKGKVLFSSDGKELFFTTEANKNVRVWDVSTGEQTNMFMGHTAKIYDMSLSHDGAYLASASHDCTVRIWDALSGVCVKTEMIDQFGSISFAPTDKKLTVVSINDGKIRIVEFPTLQKIVNKINGRFKNRQLTKEERKKYFLR